MFYITHSHRHSIGSIVCLELALLCVILSHCISGFTFVRDFKELISTINLWILVKD